MLNILQELSHPCDKGQTPEFLYWVLCGLALPCFFSQSMTSCPYLSLSLSSMKLSLALQYFLSFSPPVPSICLASLSPPFFMPPVHLGSCSDLLKVWKWTSANLRSFVLPLPTANLIVGSFWELLAGWQWILHWKMTEMWLETTNLGSVGSAAGDFLCSSYLAWLFLHWVTSLFGSLS